ncbi:hypothetical protein LJD42_10865 [Escherichia coli]|uniref:hypothetical protein n=2 Tax=Escherichia coli TaxID=562 RepID=UPI001D09CBFA|nr:hypothetical protein [Escherichia coli]MCB8832189.1 hypothetical protein [Escherichia coli]MDD9089417.1 hypothetical protein [Escherichia coli]
MAEVTVRSKDELEKAQKSKAEIIIIEGELANKIKKTKAVTKVSGVVIAAMIATCATIPLTGGGSVLVVSSLAALSGLDIAVIIAAASIGIALIIAVFRDYEEIEFSNGKMILKLKRKKMSLQLTKMRKSRSERPVHRNMNIF